VSGIARPFRWHDGAMLATTVAAWLPALLLGTAIAVSSVAGCTLNEATIHPCVILGWDAGGLLYTFAVSGWLMLVTLPFMAVTTALWLGRGVYLVVRWLIARRTASPGAD
jgi:hypothetical protein